MELSRNRLANLRTFANRYGAWDGNQSYDDVDTGKVFDQIADYFFQYNDITISLHLILREGVTDADGNPLVRGIEDLLEQLQQRRQELLEQYTLDHALDEIRDKLNDILNRERQAVEKRGPDLPPGEKDERLQHLNTLPRRLSHALRELRTYRDDRRFLDKAAAQAFDELLKQLEELEEVERFRDHFPFTGDEARNFEQTQDLMEEMRLLEMVEQALRNGRWSLRIEFPEGTTADDLREALGDDLYNQITRLQTLTQRLEDEGYLKKKGDRYHLTPRGKRRIGEKALRDIFDNTTRDRLGKHDVQKRGASQTPTERTKPYDFGDALFLDLGETLRNALARGGAGEGPHPTLDLEPQDFEVHQTEYQSKSATVLLLDTSWSMAWFNRFTAAKKVAIALNSLIRTRFPKDSLYIIGFDSHAREIKVENLIDVSWAGGVYGTNMQHALQIARRRLAREGGKNRQIIMISDGEPTAHFDHGQLFFQYPPSQRTLDATLREVMRCTRENIIINVFMLEEYSYLREFVDKITKINRGRAFFTTPDQLGRYLLVDYRNRRRKQIR